MAVAAQKTNNSTIKSILYAEKLTGPNITNWYRNLRIVLWSENKLAHFEQPLIPLPVPVATQVARDAYDVLFDAQNEEDGQSVSSYLLKMKRYLDILERLDYAMPNELSVSLILNSLNKDYDQFMQNYNMHSMGKTIAELHPMLKLYEKGIPKKGETPAVLAIREGRIKKDKKKPQGAKEKDSIFHHYKEVGHWRRNFLSHKAELRKKKNASGASTSNILTIELYAFPNKTWVYDTSCGNHICNTLQGLKGSWRLKHGALSLYVRNGMRAAIEAIGSFDSVLPSGLIIVLDNCHFAPTITR
ncbi:hypothetical protein Tco_0044905 [Tanacetum coccineum]